VSTTRELDLSDDDPKSIHTLLTFLHDPNEPIRCTIDNSSVSGILISAAMRYAIADKYEVENLKTVVWSLIEKTLSIIRIAAESFEKESPYRVEEVMRHILEGFFLATDMQMDTFREDAEQGIVDFLEYISHNSHKIPVSLQKLVGKELHSIVFSPWKCPVMQSKIARCAVVAEGFIEQTIDTTRFLCGSSLSAE